MVDVRKTLLIVDDSPADLQVLMQNLTRDYAVIAATNGTKAIEMAGKSTRPEIILMDVMMPEMDGYETCKKLKADANTADIDVIFISAHDSTQEILTGYEAGGSDYVIKPIVPDTLLQKVRVLVEQRDVREALNSDKNMAMETAMIAVSNAGELGVVLNFFRDCFSVEDVDPLADLINNSISGYLVDSTVQLRTPFKTVTRNLRGEVSPLEQELLSRMVDAERIREYKDRMIITFPDVSVLIKGMPIDDPERCGRIRDHLTFLAEGAEQRLKVIGAQYGLNIAKAHKLTQLVAESEQTLNEIQDAQIRHRKANVDNADKLLQDLEASFLSLGLTEEQEEYFMKLISDGVTQSLQQYEAGLLLDQKMRKIINEITSLTKT